MTSENDPIIRNYPVKELRNYPVATRGGAMSMMTVAKCGDEVRGGFICAYCGKCLACCHCQSSKRDYIHDYHDVQK